ncbi:LOW QUALITY PROTEIN: Vitamin B12 dependent methionine synthase activation region [Thermoanaerobacter wiegelii Rt8.B1]|uniref:Vitamin B12 dependent methionine synthase activation region n=1 Tax=Thermoanaerobacter wiegelii Rt8.B1 TaxID=697303 RepID=G2MTT1_9THEO|nr:LOW QUALITY PROTEIN: Vitamin B12 dependent methionine synthase activation region [Thermoanaerobacter wiegelii Rt8.B1]
MKVKAYPIEIDKESVIKYLGYKDKKVPEDISKEIDIAIKESSQIIDAKICYDEFKIQYDESKKQIILPDGSIFKDEYTVKNIKDADYIIMAIMTLGKEIDDKISYYFNNGDYMKGMIYESIGVAALDYLSKKFWQDLMKDVSKQGLGITHRLCPGDSRWDIKDQRIIFKNLDASTIGVSLNENYMMTPTKSTSMIYGIGKNIKTSLIDHECEDCDLVNCIYRHTSKKTKHVLNVEYMGQRKTILAEKGENLFRALIKNSINIPSDCGGHHICGKCKIIVDSDADINEVEKKFLTEEEIKSNIRLACFLNVDRNLNITIPDTKGEAVILTDNKGISLKSLKPRVMKKFLDLSKPSLEDQRGDYERITDILGKETKIPFKILNKLPDILEKHNYQIVSVIRNNEIISLENLESFNQTYGIAIDIGTTTIAAYLYNIQTGEKIDVISTLNPQKTFGADIISRIDYTITEEDGLQKMHEKIIEEMNNIINNFCKRNKISRQRIYEVILVGNTTMIHFVLNVPAKNIANAPFIPAFTSKMEIKARELNININPEGYIITLPMVASYVGADTIAAVLASRMYEKEEISLLVDIGTNGEIVLGNREKLVACSTAAGPAFEGAGITFGIGGVVGAIDHVELSKRPIYTTIGNAEPKGICGSGVVDAIAELVKLGIVDMTGRILSREEIANKDIPLDIIEKNKKIKEYKDEKAFQLDEENGIYLTQKDIRQIQLAKGAIYAGIKVLIKEMGIKAKDIKKMYFAGGFGNYISVESAATIGLIPKELKDRVEQIGNAAGTGAVMALLSEDELKKTEEIKKMIKYIELSSMPSFQEEFMYAMYFKN